MSFAPCSFKILYIDDNKDLTNLFGMILDQMGYQCFTAFDGEEGIKKANECLPDIIFCDIGLPKINGFEVAKTIKKSKMHQKTVLIAVTGYTQHKDLASASESGYDYIIPKPFDLSALEKVLDRACHTLT